MNPPKTIGFPRMMNEAGEKRVSCLNLFSILLIRA